MQERARRWHDAWPTDVPRHFDVEQDISALLRRTAQAHGEHPALSFYGNDYTYSFIDRQIDRFANALLGLGLAKGDRVGLFLQNSPQFVIGYFGVLRAGGVVVCLNPMFKQAELDYEINDAGCRMLLASDSLYGEVCKLGERVDLERVIVTWLGEYCSTRPDYDLPKEVTEKRPPWPDVLDFQSLLAEASPEPPRVELDLHQDLALLQYTGGTTGLPKGAMITHHALAYVSVAINQWFANTKEDVYLGAAPFFHIMGMLAMMCAPLLSGGKLVVLSRFVPEQVARTISEQKVTGWVGATTMLVALLGLPDLDRYDFTSLRFICTGGAPVGVELQQRIQELAPDAMLMEGYGLTESISHGGVVTPRGGYRPGFAGVPHTNDMKIVDLSDRTRELGPGEAGEIAIKGPATFIGYWQRPQETDSVIAEGWVYTGDVGMMDERGYLKLLGRQKELIKCSGFSVFPAEVENLLYRHPAVAEVAVIGVPDEYRGESVKAFVILKPEYVGQVSEPEILDWCRENLSAYKRPREMVFCQELPKSGAGKILRRVLKEREESA